MRKAVIIIGSIAAILAAAVLGILFWHQQDTAAHITIDGVRYRRDITELDLSGSPVADLSPLEALTALERLDLRDTGLTAEQYEQLRQVLPGCEIAWTPLFQGTAYAADTEKLTISAISDADMEMLRYFPGLKAIDAAGCHDYAQLRKLEERYSGLDVTYSVELGGKTYPRTTEELTLSGLSAGEAELPLSCLPQLKRVVFAAPLPPAEELQYLTEVFPDVALYWETEICGVPVTCQTTELDLSGIPLTGVDEVEGMLGYIPKVETVIMCDCGISNEEMDALNRRHEDIRFVWNVSIGAYITIRTDTTAFAPVKFGYTVNDRDCENLRYCTEMVCLDLGHQYIAKCDFAAYMPHLKYLIVADTGLNDITPLTGLQELIYLEMFLTEVKDYTPLTTLTALEDLNMCYTKGKPDAICQMTWLKRLWWSGSGMSQAQADALLAALPDTQIVLRTFSSTGVGWRQHPNYYDMRDCLGMPYMS